MANWDNLESIFLRRTEYKPQENTAINIQISPGVKYKLNKLVISPFKTIQKAPNKDKKIPINCRKVVLVWKINHEKPIIKTGAIEAIKEELITRVVCREI